MKINTSSEAQQIAQAIYSTSSVTSGVAFWASRKIVGTFVNTRKVVFVTRKLLKDISEVSTNALEGVAGKNQNTKWIVSLSGVALATLAAYKFCAMPTATITSALISGAVCRTHMFFMALSSIGLRSSINDLFSESNRFTALAQDQKDSIKNTAGMISGATFLVSSVALTILLKNPILANAIAYPVSMVVNAAAERVLKEWALSNLPNPAVNNQI